MALCIAATLLAVCFLTINVLQVAGQCSYYSLSLKYRQCASEYRTLTTLTREQHEVSGVDIVDIFDGFCDAKDAIHDCVKDHIADSSCSESEQTKAFLRENFDLSEACCDGHYAIELISDLFSGIPPVPVHEANDPCMEMAKQRSERCRIEMALAMSIENVKDIHEQYERIQESMVCVYKGFGSDVCPLQTGLLTTVLVYKDQVIPPLFGVNVTRSILRMAKYYEQHIEK